MASKPADKGIKTPDQIEFAELFEKLKWSNADVARALGYSNRSAITLILDGQSGISKMRLQMLRDLVAKNESGREQVLEMEERLHDDGALRDQLSFLKRNAPAKYDSARLMIDSLHQSALNASPKGAELSPEQATGLGASGAAKKIAQGLPQTTTKPGTISRKRKRGGGAHPGKK